LLPLIASLAALAATPTTGAATFLDVRSAAARQPAAVTAPAADPLTGNEWWRAVIGADRAVPPGPGKPITIVDSGLDISHPEFAGRPETTLLNRQTVRDEEDDHGTEVASVVGAPANGVGVVGVYPSARLYSWDASPNGLLSDAAAIQGIREAARLGPGVINLSFGGPLDNPELAQAIMFAVRSGSLVVAAAGNDGSENVASYPAEYAHVLTVGATDERDFVTDFSTTTPWIDLAAPGVQIPVAEPTSFDASGYVLDAAGTSFSSPMVAAAAAWIWTLRPELDSSQLFEIMRRSARDIDAPGWDIDSGYGILDIEAALAMPAPPRDPYEPNDDAEEVEPHRLFDAGTPALTTLRRGSAALTARVDLREDPHDFYRVLVPAHRRVAATTTGSVDLRIFRRSVRPLRTKPVAVSAHVGGGAERVSYTNTTATALYVYAEVRPGKGTRDATYTLAVTTAAARR
jgi:subtilisin family serine protease